MQGVCGLLVAPISCQEKHLKMGANSSHSVLPCCTALTYVGIYAGNALIC